jgi:hypothetical protein
MRSGDRRVVKKFTKLVSADYSFQKSNCQQTGCVEVRFSRNFFAHHGLTMMTKLLSTSLVSGCERYRELVNE